MENNFLWWRDGVIYQIYTRSFQDSNHDGIGDLNGIINRLDYLEQLGVDAIWLTPINPSPDVDFGYDVSDYFGIDPKYGSMNDFDRLLTEAHKRGIRVILDLVLKHTSDQHPWFQESRKSINNPFRDYYIWRDKKPGANTPNNWASIFGGSGWEWEEQTRQFYFHMFYKEQPDVNWRNPKVRQAMLDIFSFWLDKGVDGFRLDVFNAYFKHPDFPDNPPCLGLRKFERQKHIYDINQPEMFPLLREIRHVLDSRQGRYAVGETFIGDKIIASQYCQPGLLHATFNFDLLHSRWNARKFYRAIQEWDNVLSETAYPTQVLNNHDNPRSATRFGRGEDDERLKVAAALLLTIRGTPYLYYGEEIGMRDIRVKRKEIHDPIGKRYWPLYTGRDGCRAPMQWDCSEFSGFSTKQPWLPIHINATVRNVETQSDNPQSLLNFYRKLIHLRKNFPALQHGLWIPLTYEPRLILAYLRKTEQQTILVALNFTRRHTRLLLGRELAANHWRLLISNKQEGDPKINNGCIEIQPEEACLYVQE